MKCLGDRCLGVVSGLLGGEKELASVFVGVVYQNMEDVGNVVEKEGEG